MKIAGIAALIVAAAGVAGVALSPVVHGQERAAQAPRVVEMMLGGSRIGVSVRDPDVPDGDKAAGTAGVLVEDVAEDSPAAQAGIRKGDTIVEFDGERVRSVRQLTRLVQETPAGRTVPAIVLRDGQRTTVSVTPRESDRGRMAADLGHWAQDLRARIAPPPPPAPPAPPPPPRGWALDDLFGQTGRLGVALTNLSPQLAEYFGAKEGVLVTSVDEDTVAARAGLRAGDVITSINGEPVRAPADVRRVTQSLKGGESFSIVILRERKPLTLQGTYERQEPRRTVGARV